VLESTFPDALKNLRELLEIDVRDNIAINNGS
jgi:hypothetical protein